MFIRHHSISSNIYLADTVYLVSSLYFSIICCSWAEYNGLEKHHSKHFHHHNFLNVPALLVAKQRKKHYCFCHTWLQSFASKNAPTPALGPAVHSSSSSLQKWWMWRVKKDLRRCINAGCKRERDEWHKDSDLHLAHPAFLDCSFTLSFVSGMLFSWLGLGPSFVWCGNKASVTTGMGPLGKTAKGLWSVTINKTWLSLSLLWMKLCQDLHHLCASVRHAQTCDGLLYSRNTIHKE